MKHEHNREHLPEYLQCLIEGKYTLRQVAQWTGFTREYLCVLKKRFKKEGPACLVNGHKGKPGPRAIPQEVKDKIVSIYKKDFITNGDATNFTVFRDALESLYGISYSYRAVYDMLTAAGIESPEKRKKGRKKAHRPRPRRTAEGEMLQADACSFEWFLQLGDSARYTMHGAIDDATSKITALYLTKNECSYGYYSCLEQTIKNYGLPEAIYTDQSRIFCVNSKEKEKPTKTEQLEEETERRTQWQRILFELEIGQILAHSPQAKGRIERLWRTLQGRIPIEFKLRGIRTIEEANRFLAEEFIPAFNAKFAIEAKKPPVWRKPHEGWEDKLCNKVERKANSADVVSYMNRKLLVKADCAGRKVTLCIFKDRIRALHKGSFYDVELVEEPSRRNRSASLNRDHASKVLREIIDKTLN